MITFGLGNLALLTWGLGKSLPHWGIRIVESYPNVEFVDKPWGISLEETTGPVSFEEESIEFKEKEVTFKDK